jgi:hypothetical protein
VDIAPIAAAIKNAHIVRISKSLPLHHETLQTNTKLRRQSKPGFSPNTLFGSFHCAQVSRAIKRHTKRSDMYICTAKQRAHAQAEDRKASQELQFSVF